MNLKAFLIVPFLGWIALSANAASFDCAKASTKVEHMICADSEISKLDEELNTAYTVALQDKTRADSIKQAQKTWLSSRNRCVNLECLKSAYISRTRLLQQKISLKDPHDVCSVVAQYTNEGHLGELVKSSGVKVPMGSKTVDLIFTSEGSGHYPAVHATESGTDIPVDDVPLPPSPESEMYGVGDSLGMISYRDNNYIIYYTDLRHPISMKSLADGSVCEFKSSTKEKLSPNPLDPELCTLLQQNSGSVLRVPFETSAQMSEAEMSKKMDPVRDEILGTHVLDFANNGKPVNIAKLYYLLPGGTGCAIHDFKQINASGTQFEDGPGSELIEYLQSSVKISHTPCDSDPEFFTYKKRIYYEMKPRKWPPDNQADEYHFVSTIIDGKVHTVCKYQFETLVEPMKN